MRRVEIDVLPVEPVKGAFTAEELTGHQKVIGNDGQLFRDVPIL
jgi:hypothetical protein